MMGLLEWLIRGGIRRSLLAVAAFSNFAATARAEAAADTADDNSTSDIIVWGRGIDLVGVAQSASQGLVGYRDFDQRPLARTGELLEAIPGMIATQHSGEGKANQYFLRGFNLDHGTDFAGFVDGVPVNMRTHGHGQGYMDFNFVIPELVERIDYRKGPYWADVGDFDAAGTANMTTRSSLAAPFVDVTLGQYGYLRGVAAGSFETGGGTLLIGGAATTNNGPWDLDDDLRNFSGLLKYSHGTPDAGWGVQFGGYTAKWNATDQVPQRAIDSGLIDRLGYIDPDLGGQTTRLWAEANAGFSGFTASAYVVSYKFKLTSNFTYYLDDPVNGDEFQQVDRRNIFGGTLAKSWDVALGPVPTKITIGGDTRYDDIGTVGLYHSVAGVRTGTVRQDAVNEFSAAFYARDDFTLTPKLRAMVALRGDHYGYDVTSSIAENSGSGTQTMWSPKATLAWRVADTLELYANYGAGLHSNDARGAAISVDPNTLEPAEPVDLLVRAQGAELGARFAQGRFTATLTGFWLHLDSELVFTGDGGTTEPNPASRRLGVEFAGFWRPTDALTLDLSVAATSASFVDVPTDAERIPNAITNVVGAGATWDFGHGFTTTLRVRHFGAAPLIEDGSVWSQPTTIFNLGGYWSTGRLRLGLDVYNLRDSHAADISYFYASRLPGEPAEGVDDIHIHPVEPRQVRLSARVSL
jgi:outer membrane receptor protein involved in Fe transport